MFAHATAEDALLEKRIAIALERVKRIATLPVSWERRELLIAQGVTPVWASTEGCRRWMRRRWRT